VAHRISRHNDSLAFPKQSIFSLSTVEVLVSPTLPFLSLMMGIMAATTAAAAAKFPIPDKILVPSGVKLNMLTHSLDVELMRHDGVFHSRLSVLLPREEGPSATAVAGHFTEASRRVVKAVPPGTHHWYLCDECMLVGSRTEEHVYSSMIFGGALGQPSRWGSVSFSACHQRRPVTSSASASRVRYLSTQLPIWSCWPFDMGLTRRTRRGFSWESVHAWATGNYCFVSST
jgi:hypothetical protein